MREAVPAVRVSVGSQWFLSGCDILPVQPLLRLRRSRWQSLAEWRHAKACPMFSLSQSDKGYPYQFTFVRNARHCARAMKMQLLPQALEYVWQGYVGVKSVSVGR